MGFGRSTRVCLGTLTVLSWLAMPGLAQTLPWNLYADDASASVCDAVNAANAELVVLSATGQLVLVTGEDLTLQDSFVDADGFVYFEGSQAGVIGFALDGDGFRSLWWTSLTGHVVHVDGFTGAPSETDFLPLDFSDAACDACDYWDDRLLCGSDDLPPITINFCGANSLASLSLTLASMGFVSLMRRRSM